MKKTTDWSIRNYLIKHGIYADNSDMQTIIMNSYFNQMGGDNDTEWKDKIAYIGNHFGKFCQYAQGWKSKL